MGRPADGHDGHPIHRGRLDRRVPRICQSTALMLVRNRPFFVVGTARCGSTLLGRMLGAHSHLACIHEFFTALGDERAFVNDLASGEMLRALLTTPDPDAVALMQLGEESV